MQLKTERKDFTVG